MAYALSGWLGELSCNPQPRPFPWNAYACEMRELEVGGERHPYIAMAGEGRLIDLDGIRSELFNHDLQAVDVREPDSILSFCSAYGVPTTPLYNGEQRLRLYKLAREVGAKYSPATWKAIRETHANLQVISALGEREANLDPRNPSLEMDPLLPARLSELARGDVASADGVRGAVSLLEVAQAIRLLQSATILPMALRYAAANGMTVDALVDYLDDSRFAAVGGTKYCRYSTESIFLGHPLEGYDTMLRRSDFREMVARSVVDDPRPIYDEALAYALHQGARRALEILELASTAYRMPVLASHLVVRPKRSTRSLDPFASRLATPDIDRVAARISDEGCVSYAVVYQFMSSFCLDDGEAPPYRRCENCGRIFRKYQDEGAAKNIRNTRFCRKNCNFAFNKREARRRGKQY